MEELQQKNEYEIQQVKTDLIEKHEKVIVNSFCGFTSAGLKIWNNYRDRGSPEIP